MRKVLILTICLVLISYLSSQEPQETKITLSGDMTYQDIWIFCEKILSERKLTLDFRMQDQTASEVFFNCISETEFKVSELSETEPEIEKKEPSDDFRKIVDDCKAMILESNKNYNKTSAELNSLFFDCVYDKEGNFSEKGSNKDNEEEESLEIVVITKDSNYADIWKYCIYEGKYFTSSIISKNENEKSQIFMECLEKTANKIKNLKNQENSEEVLTLITGESTYQDVWIFCEKYSSQLSSDIKSNNESRNQQLFFECLLKNEERLSNMKNSQEKPIEISKEDLTSKLSEEILKNFIQEENFSCPKIVIEESKVEVYDVCFNSTNSTLYDCTRYSDFCVLNQSIDSENEFKGHCYPYGVKPKQNGSLGQYCKSTSECISNKYLSIVEKNVVEKSLCFAQYCTSLAEIDSSNYKCIDDSSCNSNNFCSLNGECIRRNSAGRGEICIDTAECYEESVCLNSKCIEKYTLETGRFVGSDFDKKKDYDKACKSGYSHADYNNFYCAEIYFDEENNDMFNIDYNYGLANIKYGKLCTYNVKFNDVYTVKYDMPSKYSCSLDGNSYCQLRLLKGLKRRQLQQVTKYWKDSDEKYCLELFENPIYFGLDKNMTYPNLDYIKFDLESQLISHSFRGCQDFFRNRFEVISSSKFMTTFTLLIFVLVLIL